jgi:hypothetical protein
LKALAEEMQAVSKGLEKVEQELTGSENDGAISCNIPSPKGLGLLIIFLTCKDSIRFIN